MQSAPTPDCLPNPPQGRVGIATQPLFPGALVAYCQGPEVSTDMITPCRKKPASEP